jgi:DivIVA domain-containing protein
MIDLTPLDVRKKAGDFTKSLRGYEPQQVESFLELAAERLEELVKENLTLRERGERLAEQVEAQTGRERAVNDALVTAQQLREDIASSAEREADAVRAEAKVQADRIRAEAEETARRLVADAENRLADLRQAAREITRRKARFLGNFRQLLEREMDVVEMQEAATVEDYMVVGLGSEALSAGATIGAPGTSEADASAGAAEMAALASEVADAACAGSEAAPDAESGSAPYPASDTGEQAPAEATDDFGGEAATEAEPEAEPDVETGPDPANESPRSGGSRWTTFEYAADDAPSGDAEAPGPDDETSGDLDSEDDR